jgi:hypothetical protein
MHELPAASWLLIILSTVPWLVWAAVHYLRNARRRPACVAQENRN